MHATAYLIALVLCSAPAEPVTDSRQVPRPAGAWEVQFADGISAADYARQLDALGIELAAVAPDGRIEYAAQLAQRKPQRRVGSEALERRLGIRWRRGTLLTVDRALLGKAGISTAGKQIVHYYPDALVAELVKLERAFASRPPDQIERTRFRVVARPGQEPPCGVEVIEQQPREAAAPP